MEEKTFDKTFEVTVRYDDKTCHPSCDFLKVPDTPGMRPARCDLYRQNIGRAKETIITDEGEISVLVETFFSTEECIADREATP